jgi:hypothetical protein
MWIKIIILVAVITFITAAVGGGYMLFKQQQETIAQQREENAKLLTAVDQQKEAIEAIEEGLKEQALIKDDLEKEIQSARRDMDNFQNKIMKHDLKAIAGQKAELLEKKINRASNDVMRCFEIVTGDPIQPNEQNKQCPDLFTNPVTTP